MGRTHPACVPNLPIATRTNDKAYVEMALPKCESVEELQMLEAVYDAMTLSGGAASSSAG